MSTLILPACFLPDPAVTAFDSLMVSAHQRACTIQLHTTPRTAACPHCQHPSGRVHSRYTRQIMDLPLATVLVTIRLVTRRFFCDQVDCARQIFTERLPTMVAPYARRTCRLRHQHSAVGLALGGRAAAQLTEALQIPLGRDGLLADIRAIPLPAFPPPTVIGVDDWAFRKGHTYGTIVLDLEAHRPLDLLADRTPDTVAAWLEAHPSVTHVRRDRATAYADAVY